MDGLTDVFTTNSQIIAKVVQVTDASQEFTALDELIVPLFSHGDLDVDLGVSVLLCIGVTVHIGLCVYVGMWFFVCVSVFPSPVDS